MKKILTLAVAFIAIASQAASIDWTINTGARTMKDSTGTKMTGTAYLILSSDIASIEASKTADANDFVSALTSTALGSTSITAGKASPTSGTASNGKLTAGIEYTYQYIIFDSVNNEYYLSASKTIDAYDAASPDAALTNPKKISFSAEDMGATSGTTASTQTFSSAVKAGGDDPVGPAVPEPATGALAIAGIALLFRRRRA